MSLYGTQSIKSIEELGNSDEMLEAFIVDDLMKGTSEQIKEFCESAEAKALQEKAVLKKPTMMRLSKQDDMKRRVKLAAYQLAKDSNDPMWAKLKIYTKKRKECIGKIMQKYGPKAERIAKITQKNYIATASKGKVDDEK